MGRALRKCNLCGVNSLFDKNKKSRLAKIACYICDNYFLGTPAYVIVLGLIGTVITGFDIIRIMNSKMPLRCGNRQRGGGDVVPVDVERDLKLMTSILGIEHYTLIMLGAITEYPMLHSPWLLMQLCVIMVEIIVFFVRLFLDGLHVKRDEILLAFLADKMRNKMSFSWAQISSLSLNRSILKVDLSYVSLMCLMANFLSSIALEAGTKLRQEQTASKIKSAAFPAFFHRAYNLKIRLLVSDLLSGCISTLLVIFGTKYNVPYLYIPWLVTTMRGMIFSEGPTLLSLAHALLPDSDKPTKFFLFTTLVLYVEELCLWNEVFSNFRRCWFNYHEKHRTVSRNKKNEEQLVAGDSAGNIYDEYTDQEKSSNLSETIENHEETTLRQRKNIHENWRKFGKLKPTVDSITG